ncbi:MAG: hypothetical protein NT123_22485 [Proteobacteria bacterium]|nr:hypothetical protein [Pseudomonadota bacterium]
MRGFVRANPSLDAIETSSTGEVSTKKRQETKNAKSKTKNPQVVYSTVELTDEQVKAMWAAHPGIEKYEVIDSL